MLDYRNDRMLTGLSGVRQRERQRETQWYCSVFSGGLADVPRGSILEIWSSLLLPPPSQLTRVGSDRWSWAGSESDGVGWFKAREREGGRGREGFLISSPLVRCYQATHMVRYRLFCHPTHPDTSQQYLNQPDSGEWVSWCWQPDCLATKTATRPPAYHVYINSET